MWVGEACLSATSVISTPEPVQTSRSSLVEITEDVLGMNINGMKYKVMHLGINNKNFDYRMGIYLETTEEERDLSELVNVHEPPV